ncbi:MAG: hypothetical protein KDD53_11510, partial [Bdellovibrionales bacterium]|nr:hypothetical protein [Bdellovibrionales bacterium]
GGYTVPATGSANTRYAYTGGDGTDGVNTVKVTDGISIAINTPGNQVFDTAIEALERLGRALSGYRTTPVDANGIPNGTPDGGGTAFVFPQDFHEQTQDILETMALIDTAKVTEVTAARTSVAARLTRLDAAGKTLNDLSFNVKEVLASLQDSDIFAAATDLTQAQTILEASLSVTGRLLGTTILDYI